MLDLLPDGDTEIVIYISSSPRTRSIEAGTDSCLSYARKPSVIVISIYVTCLAYEAIKIYVNLL